VATPTPHRFDDPIWPIRDVLGWVLDRDPAKFGRLHTEEDLRSALGVVFYTRWPRPENDPQVLMTVLHALQRGDLVAYDGTNLIARDFWTDKTRQYMRGSTRFLFRREDVLVLLPDPRTLISRAPPPIRPLRGGRNPAMMEDVASNRAGDGKPARVVDEAELDELYPDPGVAPKKPRSGKKRKRHAYRREEVESAMRAGLVRGEITRERLEAMLEKELASQYGASRDTCRKARNAVLAGTESIDSPSTNDK
jgi:hypothetical protein